MHMPLADYCHLARAGPGRSLSAPVMTLWRVPDALARITRMLAERPEGGALARFLPTMDGMGPERELGCRAAVASTFLAGLELACDGTLALYQQQPSQTIETSRV